MSTWLMDLRLAFRTLRRAPGFALTVIVVMALGIGVNTMMFSVLRTILDADLPFASPDRIVAIEESSQRTRNDAIDLSAPDFLDVKAAARSLSSMAGSSGFTAMVNFGGDAERFRGTTGTAELLDVLGIRPQLGRWFTPDESIDGHQYATVVLSDQLWRQRFQADPHVLGRAIRVNARVRTIVGVLPPGIRFPENSDVFVPLGMRSDEARTAHYLETIARLAPGQTIASAKAELQTISGRIARANPETNAGQRTVVTNYREHLVREVRPVMILLQLAVLFVLLIACGNVANLTLARATSRARELSVRLALGSGRSRLVRQLLSESVVLATLGGLGGVLVAQWGLAITLHSIPEELPFWMHFGIDRGVLLFNLGLSVFSGLLFGVLPAWQAADTDLRGALHDGGSGSGDSRRRARLRHAFVVSEIALAVVLLIGSGLMVRSFLRVQELRTGVDPEGVLVADYTLPYNTYPKSEQWSAFTRGFVQSITRLPGVTSASAVAVLHLGGDSWSQGIAPEGMTGLSAGNLPIVHFNSVEPGYLRTMGIPLHRGRDFTAADVAGAPKVALVNESAARRLWPHRDAIGARFDGGGTDTTGPVTVIGVYADVAQNVNDRRDISEVLRPMPQEPAQGVSLAIRTTGSFGGLAGALRRLMRERDPDVALYHIHSMREHIQQAAWEPRLYASLMGAFALLALLIAGLGIHGVMAYAVAQRTREIGIRMALGAAREDVQRMVVSQAMRLTLLGMGLGLAGAFALTRFMASLLFQVRPGDPPTYVGVVLILAVSALLSAWAPAARATRVDPMVALRHE